MESMKVVALGGSGGMGRWAVRTALGYDFVNEIVIADLDEVRGQAFADKCGDRTSFQRIDVNDQPALKGLLSGADVVMTTVGPYYRFGVPILETAIEVGCHYIDINDDWEPTLEMLDLHEKAEEAGITAIIGLGASPGQSNMVAARALSLLDSADELITGWRVSSDVGEEDTGEEGLEASGTLGAATEHWVHQFTGTIRVLKDGVFVDVKPMQEISIDYPGIGKGTAYTVGHPEPVTLPLFRTDIEQSCNVMVITPWQAEVLRETARQVDAGETTVREAAGQLMARLSEREGQESAPAMEGEGEPRLPSLFALAKGMKDGKKKTVAVTVIAGHRSMGESTGIPLAIGLKLLHSGKITRHGVFAPEQVIDPDDFFNEFAPLCIYPAPQESADEMLYITES